MSGSQRSRSSSGIAVGLRQLHDLASDFTAADDADERHCAGEEELVEFGGATVFGFAVGGEHLGSHGGAVGHEPSRRHVIGVLLAVLGADRRHVGHCHPQQFVAAGDALDDLVEARRGVRFVGDDNQQQPPAVAKRFEVPLARPWFLALAGRPEQLDFGAGYQYDTPITGLRIVS